MRACARAGERAREVALRARRPGAPALRPRSTAPIRRPPITQRQGHVAQRSGIDDHAQLAAGNTDVAHLVAQRGHHNS